MIVKSRTRLLATSAHVLLLAIAAPSLAHAADEVVAGVSSEAVATADEGDADAEQTVVDAVVINSAKSPVARSVTAGVLGDKSALETPFSVTAVTAVRSRICRSATSTASSATTPPSPSGRAASLNSYKGHAERIVAKACEGNLTLRQTAYLGAVRRSDFVGSPRTVADAIERWFEGRVVDGFILQVQRPSDFGKFRDKVLPILRERGLFRDECEHDTLRGHLGLPVPENRWARAARTLRAAE